MSISHRLSALERAYKIVEAANHNRRAALAMQRVMSDPEALDFALRMVARLRAARAPRLLTPADAGRDES